MTQNMGLKLQRNVVKLFNSILNNKNVKRFLEDLKNYHIGTYEHSLRVGFLSMFLGAENGFSEGEIKLLGYAGLLHDIGKLDIPRKILDKKSILDEKERKRMEEHCHKGFLRLKDFEESEVKEIVILHHKYQIKSYPKNCQMKKKSCKLAQVVAIADIFDALSNERAYKKKLSNGEVKRILRESFLGEKKFLIPLEEDLE